MKPLPSAGFPTAKVSSACSPSIRRALPKSKSRRKGGPGGRSSIIFAPARARKPPRSGNRFPIFARARISYRALMYRRCGFRHERKLRALGISTIAGIDEAGRGALAGPVVAAAVILPEKFRHRKLNDSKQLLPELRQEIYDELVSRADICWSVGIVDSVEIDQINILRATHKAMRFALNRLPAIAEHVLIDGLPVLPFPLPQTAIIDGDCISLSIAAASVIAKVTRVRLM